MSSYYTIRAYCCNDAAHFRQQVEQVAKALSGSVTWGKPGERDQDLRLHHGETCQSLYLPYQPAETEFVDQLGEQLNVPWIELRIQSQDIWDYGLIDNNKCIDTFSVCPQYWDLSGPDPVEWEKWRGQPELLAKTWGIPVEKINRYLVYWGFKIDDERNFEFELQGKAYPQDQFDYGDCYQMFDFLKALGGSEPIDSHTIKLPKKGK